MPRRIRPNKYRASKTEPKSERLKGFYKKILSILVLFAILSSVVGVIFFIYKGIDSLAAVNPSCSLCNSSLFLERPDVTASLYVLESENKRVGHAWLVLYNEKNAETMLVNIPPGVYINSYSETLGEYVSIADLKYAGNIISQKRDIEYLISQVQFYVGISIDNYQYYPYDALQTYLEITRSNLESNVDKYKSSYINVNEAVSTQTLAAFPFYNGFSLFDAVINASKWKKFVESIDSNLDGGELLDNLNLTKSAFSSGDLYILDLSQGWAVVDGIYNDREVFFPNYIGIDEKIGENITVLRGRELERELAKVEVYNGSDVPGFAFRYARRVQNNGVRVVRYDNAPDTSDRTIIYVSDSEKYANSLELVTSLVSQNAKVIEGRPSFITTGDIIVILGKDLEKSHNWD